MRSRAGQRHAWSVPLIFICKFCSLIKFSADQIFFDTEPIGVSLASLIARAATLPDPIHFFGSRLVVHIQTSPSAVDDLIALVKAMAAERRAEGFVPPEKAAVNGNGEPQRLKDVYVRLDRSSIEKSQKI